MYMASLNYLVNGSGAPSWMRNDSQAPGVVSPYENSYWTLMCCLHVKMYARYISACIGRQFFASITNMLDRGPASGGFVFSDHASAKPALFNVNVLIECKNSCRSLLSLYEK